MSILKVKMPLFIEIEIFCSFSIGSAIVIFCIFEQSLNASNAIFFTEGGIVILTNDVHLKKALNPIDITDGGILTSSNDEHL